GSDRPSGAGPDEERRTMTYADYQDLTFDRHQHGVLQITINRPDHLNATDERLHRELSHVWSDVDRDDETRVAVITGAGRAFSAGGDLEMIEQLAGDYGRVAAMASEAARLVLNMLDCEKPIVSAINGTAVGAGLAVALMADVSVIGQDVQLTDGHLRLGVVAGDHAAIVWPLLCGMAKAKYYLLTADFIHGADAEGIGTGPQLAARWTKRTLNHWLRAAIPTFDASLAYEMLTFMGKDVREGA